MKTFVDSPDKKINSQYNGVFPFPRGDSYGICSNYKSALFMQDDASTCTQMVNLEKDCTNTLNGEYYSKLLKVLLGPGAALSSSKAVTITDVYTYDAKTGVYTKGAATADVKST